jgi:hypothetical protein
MKTVQAYETTDGKIFRDSGEAQTHQKDLDTSGALNEFVLRHCYSGMSSNDVFDILYDNREELRGILG